MIEVEYVTEMWKNPKDSEYFLMIVTVINRLSGSLWNKAVRSACSVAVDTSPRKITYDEL